MATVMQHEMQDLFEGMGREHLLETIGYLCDDCCRLRREIEACGGKAPAGKYSPRVDHEVACHRDIVEEAVNAYDLSMACRAAADKLAGVIR